MTGFATVSACLPLSRSGFFVYSVCLWALLNKQVGYIQCKKDFLRKVSDIVMLIFCGHLDISTGQGYHQIKPTKSAPRTFRQTNVIPVVLMSICVYADRR